ncbi:hypothetical protein OUZ56_011010 [Daphnia magna]|uniref:Uncharacterized protein n=1 Tax=Daphnia magna TaxID=35525 RepID=A0ABQ9YZ29_9CRUS|nr:hypothetical protein OUZ56_011010 [Daphnia magna]
MDSAPVPITTALPDPGSSQVTTFDDSLLDSALVPITTALHDPGSSQVMFEDDFPIDSSLGPDDLIDTGSGQEPLGDVSPIYSPLLPDIDVPKGIDSKLVKEFFQGDFSSISKRKLTTALQKIRRLKSRKVVRS